MKYRILIVLSLITSITSIGNILAEKLDFVWVGCDGTVVKRTQAGKLEMSTTQKNLSGCLGPKSNEVEIQSWSIQHTEELSLDQSQQSTSQVLLSSTDTWDSYTWESIVTENPAPVFDTPIFDLTQTDMIEYRIELMRQQQIQYTNALRSVRMRAQATKLSTTRAYLMRNDAVVVTQSWAWWTAVQGADVSATDTISNKIEANTDGRAQWYIATKFLRDPNPSDLVRIKQADQQFWSDIAHVNVSHSVNVRAHPWYGSKILFVLTHATPLYVVSTVDNWSEVISDDRTIRWYIRSDYLTIEKYQRVEVAPLLK